MSSSVIRTPESHCNVFLCPTNRSSSYRCRVRDLAVEQRREVVHRRALATTDTYFDHNGDIFHRRSHLTPLTCGLARRFGVFPHAQRPDPETQRRRPREPAGVHARPPGILMQRRPRPCPNVFSARIISYARAHDKRRDSDTASCSSGHARSLSAVGHARSHRQRLRSCLIPSPSRPCLWALSSGRPCHRT